MKKFKDTTRGGNKFKIYETYNQKGYCIHGAILLEDGQWTIACWTSDGKYIKEGGNSYLDLIPLPSHPKKPEAGMVVRSMTLGVFWR